MTVTVQTPDSVPLSKVRAFLADLGLPAEGLLQFRCGMAGVFVEVRARGADGRPYRASDGTLAVHTVSIPLDRST